MLVKVCLGSPLVKYISRHRANSEINLLKLFFQIPELSTQKNKVCPNCRIRIQYSYQLRVDIIESNEQLLTPQSIKLTKLESDTSTEVYKIIELYDAGSKKKEDLIEFADVDNFNSIDIEYLVETGDNTNQSAPSLSPDDELIDEDNSENETVKEHKEAKYKFKFNEDDDHDDYDNDDDDDMVEYKFNEDTQVYDNQDAVSFLIGHSHLLNKIEENVAAEKPTKSPKRPHVCQVCSKSFLRKSNLVDHLRLHANLRLYQCEYCDKSFVQAGNFKSHLRIHTKERPFKCTMCPKTYNQSSALKVSVCKNCGVM